MSTGDLEGLHSSGKGFGMDGKEEEKGSPFTLGKEKTKELDKVRTRSNYVKIQPICKEEGDILEFSHC